MTHLAGRLQRWATVGKAETVAATHGLRRGASLRLPSAPRPAVKAPFRFGDVPGAYRIFRHRGTG